ncbi:hypothetical protein ACU9CW_004296 [Cronobacter dublinensis]
MLKKIIFSSLLLSSLYMPVTAFSAVDITKYSQTQQVSGILQDTDISAALHKTLGSSYDAFAGNFDVFGEPHRTADGGLFVEGWLQDLYLENASAFVIYPDGRVFAGWVTPDDQIIHYEASTKDSSNVNPAIKKWASRFKGMNFSLTKEQQGTGNEVEYFTTDKFLITVTTQCQSDGQCNEATYKGKRKKDGAEVLLKGVASRTDCATAPCPIISYKFKNGNTSYMLSKADNSLTVISSNKIVLDEKGVWSK